MEHHENERAEAHTQGPAGGDGSQIADMQLAIFEVAAHAQGRRVEDIKRMLQAEFERRQVTPQAGPWLDAAATTAAMGKPYIISNEALWSTNAEQDTAPDSGDA